MDKFDFINRIIALYPHAITDKQAQYDTYNRALSKDKIDFEKLMDLFAEEYKDNFPPPAGILKEMAQRCLKQEVVSTTQNKQLKMKPPADFVKKYGNNGNCDCCPSGWSEIQILNYYKNRFGGEWQIIEVY